MAERSFDLLFLLSFFLFGLFEHPAYAYIDPGTGSYLFQIMLAGFVGAAFAVKTYWIKIKGFVKKLFHKDPS